MQRILAFLVTMVAISCIPLFLITVVWLVTLGSFSYITAMHDSATVGCTMVLSVIGFIFGLVIAGDNSFDD